MIPSLSLPLSLSTTGTVSLSLSDFPGNDKISFALSKLVLIYDLYFYEERDVDIWGIKPINGFVIPLCLIYGSTGYSRG